MRHITVAGRFAAAALVSAAIACAGESRSASDTNTASSAGGAAAASTGAALTGAGSTFANPLYQKWSAEYAKAHGVNLNYASIGSGGGIRQLAEQTVDFGATDGPMTDDEMSKTRGGAVMHVPTALGAVVLTYNLPEVQQPLKMTGELIADIFLGNVKKWNDPQLAALNPGVALPVRDIVVIHRSEASGTTYVFTDYLTAVSPKWASGPGKAKDVKWPVGLGGKGNEGVTGQVKQTPGAIGYTELAYVTQNKMPAAQVKNAAGNFVAPTVESTTAAAEGAASGLPATTDYRISIVNAPGAQSYPISSFTWILVYRSQPNADKGKRLTDFLRWALTDGQQFESALDYAPLPPAMATRLAQRLDSISVAAAK